MSGDAISTDVIGDTLELMQDIKDALLCLHESPTDIGVANAIPSTTQAIQDMANHYGFKHVVAFLSVTEGVLNRIRDAELQPKANLVALLLICCDHVSEMVGQLAHRDEIYLGCLTRSHGLIRQLHAFEGHTPKYAAAA